MPRSPNAAPQIDEVQRASGNARAPVAEQQRDQTAGQQQREQAESVLPDDGREPA